jgi:hypothetical protein
MDALGALNHANGSAERRRNEHMQEHSLYRPGSASFTRWPATVVSPSTWMKMKTLAFTQHHHNQTSLQTLNEMQRDHEIQFVEMSRIPNEIISTA